MLTFRTRRALLLLVVAVLALAAAGCGTMDNDVHITYQSPTHTVTTMTLRGTGPLKDQLLSGPLRDSLSNAGWSVSSDDGGDGPATLTATYEGDDGNPFPKTSSRTANPVQALFREVKVTTDDSLFTRQMTVKFSTEPGVLGAPGLANPQSQQVLRAVLAAAGIAPQARGGGATPANPFSGLNIDQKSFDLMLDAVLKMKVTVTVPGSLKVTNADDRSGNTATWRLGAGTLRDSHEYYVVSEEILWAKVGAAAGAVLMFLAAFGLVGAYLLSKRRRPAHAAAVPIVPSSTLTLPERIEGVQLPQKTPEELAALHVPEDEELRNAQEQRPEGS